MTKREWDAISSLHQKTLVLCYSEGLNHGDRVGFAELLGHIMYAGSLGDPLYLRIQKFHRAKITYFVAVGGDEDKYQWNLRKILVAQVIVPSNRLLYALDPKGTHKLDRVRQDILQYQRKYLCFLDLHQPVQRTIVDKWHL